MERRFNETTLAIETRAGANPKIKGTASPTYDGSEGTEYKLYDNVYERFVPGAFDNWLKDNPDVVALVNHDPAKVLGRTPNTLRLATDARGLHYEIDPADTSYGRDLLTLIQRGDIRGSSFAFRAMKTKWTVEEGKEIRTVTEASLHDVSVVTTPAYGSSTVGLRSADERRAIEEERTKWLDELADEKRLSRIASLMNK